MRLEFDIRSWCYVVVDCAGRALFIIYDQPPNVRIPGRLVYLLRQAQELMPKARVARIVWLPSFAMDESIAWSAVRVWN